MKDLLKNCNLCPRACNVDRTKDLGFCGANDKLTIARCSLHFYEEPCLSGKNGSGTIFFSYCNLKCIFCQNYDISIKHIGKEISINKLANLMLDLQSKNAHNINLVTPTHYIPLIKDAIILAKNKGLKLPIIYNTSSYENVSSLKLLDGLIDIYLPDFKYYDNKLAIKYSKAFNYQKIAKAAIQEMYRQVGNCEFDKDGIMQKGVIVRHLILPEKEEDSKKIIEYLYKTYNDNIYLSIMNQYTPIKKLPYQELNKIISNETYDEIIDYAYDLGVRNAFIQEGKTQKKYFIPDFSNQDF